MSSHRKLQSIYTPGDLVTCLHAVEAYYSGYNGNPKWVFLPGTEGVVASIAPKVRIVGEPPAYDDCDEFVVVDYKDGDETRRVGLNFCNIKRVEHGDQDRSQKGRSKHGTA